MTDTLATPIDTRRKPYGEAETQRIAEEFGRDGFLKIPALFTPAEVAALRDGVDRVFEDDRWADTENRYSDYIAVRLFETDPMFEDLLTLEPIIGLAEHILGDDCHIIAQNVVRNRAGEAISGFHVDGHIWHPLPPEIERHDPRWTMPVYMMTVQILLTDVDSIEHGPTQYILGSQASGRAPDNPDWPVWMGCEPISVYGKAGDIYLHNGMTWHRGAPNTSDRTRYLLQLSYGARWVAQRFYPFMNYRLPDHVLERADDRRKRVLGFHKKGAYG